MWQDHLWSGGPDCSRGDTLGWLWTASLSQISGQLGRIQDRSRLSIHNRFCPKMLWVDQPVHNRSHHLSPPPPLFLRDFICYVLLCYPASKEAGRQKPRSTVCSRSVKSLLKACPQVLGWDPASPPWTAQYQTHVPAARVLLQSRVLAPAGAPARAAAALQML